MSGDRPQFPWGRIMQLGMGHLRLSPHEFWRSTLREISNALGHPPRPLLRQTLNALMEQYPDD
jgi:uncharacterized phage protein (TIGR02216 family)